MGSCLGPVYANAFMCHNEEIWLDNCPLNFKPLYYRRYVDDTFVIFKSSEDVDLFFAYLNRQHPNIKFTCEKETNGSLSFLDINIDKTGSLFKTTVYRKPTYTGLGLSWYSFCPNIYKMNSIKTLLNRGYNICSDFFLLHSEIEHLKEYFINNNYSINIFFSIVKDFMYKIRKESITSHNVHKQIKYVKLPYFGKISYETRKQMNKILRNCFPAVDFRFIFTNSFTIGSLFKFKDLIPDQVCSNIVYEFTCPSCSVGYIGCTSRSFKMRVFEHLGKSFRTERYLSQMPFSAVRNHSLEHDHPFSDKDFKIISRFSSSEECMLGEKILIGKFKPALNSIN